MSKRGENIYKRKDGRWEGRLDLSQVFRQIFVESVFLFSKMNFQTRLGFGNQLSYECDFDYTNLQCI